MSSGSSTRPLDEGSDGIVDRDVQRDDFRSLRVCQHDAVLFKFCSQADCHTSLLLRHGSQVPVTAGYVARGGVESAVGVQRMHVFSELLVRLISRRPPLLVGMRAPTHLAYIHDLAKGIRYRI